jgi:hypothetical protein
MVIFHCYVSSPEGKLMKISFSESFWDKHGQTVQPICRFWGARLKRRSVHTVDETQQDVLSCNQHGCGKPSICRSIYINFIREPFVFHIFISVDSRVSQCLLSVCLIFWISFPTRVSDACFALDETWHGKKTWGIPSPCEIAFQYETMIVWRVFNTNSFGGDIFLVPNLTITGGSFLGL